MHNENAAKAVRILLAESKTNTSDKSFFIFSLTCVVINPLSCSLEMIYISNFSHTLIVPLLLVVFQYPDQFVPGKNGCR